MTGKNPNQQDNRNIKKRLIDKELTEVSGGFVPIEIETKVSGKPTIGGTKPIFQPAGVTPRPGGASPSGDK